jgi:hypothetical protein
MQRTIVYFTDNCLTEPLASKCREILLRSAWGIPIISVSQQPIDVGRNICVGDIGRSHLSLFKQLALGIEAAATPVVVIAEHDCLYTPEHLNWEPPQLDVFYYNNNQWFAQWGGPHHGSYTHLRRRVLSQLIVGRDTALRAIRERVELLEAGYTLVKGAAGACEPGCMDGEAFVRDPMNKDLGKDPTRWKAERFSTHWPNLDIRHGQNFSGRRHGKEECYTLPYWGRLTDALGGEPCRALQPA